MASSTQYWSDEDEDDATQIETSIHLGVPDGPVVSASDLNDAAVSRIGGLPALLSHDAPFDSSRCRNCQNAMELLVQLWAPFEDSPYDRAAYVWGCARSGCQRKSGSIRAWRGLRYNEKFASKLERKLAGKQGHDRAPKALLEGHNPPHQSVNPFAIPTEVATTPHAGLGTDIFNSIAPPDSGSTITSHDPARDEESTESDDEHASSSSSASSVVVALVSATLVDSLWQSAPSYPPQYLSTISEPIHPSSKAPDGPIAGDVDAEGLNPEGHAGASEKYENSMHMDHLFDRFNERVAREPQQCVRYELGGIPLPFSSDDLSKQLFPFSPEGSTSTTVTKAAFNVQNPPTRRVFDAASIPSCLHCGSRRVFEYQLMPNLINILGGDSGAGGEDVMSDERRKEAIQRLLKGDPDGRGMEWGTVLVFSCEKDCCTGTGDKDNQSAWTEELVHVHWDN